MLGLLQTGAIRMSDRLNILILHKMGDPRTWRESVAELELAFPRYAPEHNYLIHNAVVPLPEHVKNFEFDAIILNSTFLCNVFSPERLYKMKNDYRFLNRTTALKIALPQDDYYCSEELDNLMLEWKIDILHTVCPKYWHILYPRFMTQGGKIDLGYTGYVTPLMRKRALSPKKRDERLYDVVYRASGKPSFPNKLATVKAELGNIFLQHFSDQPWKMDISNSDSKTIHGSSWWDFIENSRCVLGANSGSSNLIRNHDIVRSIASYINDNPFATDDEILKACLEPEDREILFTAISPRVLEAGLLNTVQILVTGEYSGLIKPWEDFVPLQENCSNREEIICIVKDKALQEKIALSCKEKLLSTKQIQIEYLIDKLLQNITKQNNGGAFKRMHQKYLATVPLQERVFFYKLRLKQSVKNNLPDKALKTLQRLLQHSTRRIES